MAASPRSAVTGWGQRQAGSRLNVVDLQISRMPTLDRERIPVILTHGHEFERWLHGSDEEAMEFARQCPPERM
jgi:hypothetical protein